MLLGYLGIYPKFEEFKEPVSPLYRDGAEDDLDEGSEEIIAWTYKEILDEKKKLVDKDSIRNNIDLTKYETLQAESILREDELENIYLLSEYNHILLYSKPNRNYTNQHQLLNYT